jgi:sugar-specific transcriptional regulator TrmB
MDTELHQDLINNSLTIFTVLSRIDNLKVFSAAINGLKITKPVLESLGISRAKCLKALEQLEDAGLIENEKKEREVGRGQKKNEPSYIHTAYGSMVYRRYILEMGKYTKYSDKTELVDTIRNAQKFSGGVIAMFNDQIINNIVNSEGASHSVISQSTSSANASSSSSPFPSISNYENTSGASLVSTASAIPKARIVLSYDNIVQLLRERIDLCKKEILIATRTSPEIIINRILQKSKMGVKVKVVADTELVRQYFESQKEITAGNDNDDNDNNNINYDDDNSNYEATNTNDSKRKVKDNEINKNNSTVDNYNSDGYQHQQERRDIVANPYYPNTEIHRRISVLPFSMIILDGSEVGIELVNSNNSKEFFAGVWIKDEEFATAMKSFYQTIWDKASENINV